MVEFHRTIEMEHIPRTIFGVKYNKRLLTGDNNFIYNQYSLQFTKNEQLKVYNRMLKDTYTFSEVKLIKWHINANDDIDTREDIPPTSISHGDSK